MDQAFLPFDQILEKMMAFRQEFRDDEAGVRMYISGYEIESPVELDVTLDEQGRLRIGTTPPIYYVDTSVKPSFHHISFRARLTDASDLNEDPYGL